MLQKERKKENSPSPPSAYVEMKSSPPTPKGLPLPVVSVEDWGEDGSPLAWGSTLQNSLSTSQSFLVPPCPAEAKH